MMLASLGIFSALLLFAAGSDAARYLIPNWISIAVVVLFVPAAFGQISMDQAQAHLITAAAAFGLGLVLFAFRFIGGGDVKLWSAIALWLGPHLIWPHFVLVTFLGGLLGLALAAWRSFPRTTAHLVPVNVGATRVPYGVAIAAATLVLLPEIMRILHGVG